MASAAYKKQVSLLLNILPEIAKEDCFALHGGTAINLFVRDMPRLSVDVDLTYIPIEDRITSFRNIDEALERVKANIKRVIPSAYLVYKKDTGKIFVSTQKADVKIEVNMVMRGLLGDAVPMILCDKAQKEFEAFCEMNVVPIGQLYGGKICAALDRQHPRDLFDIKLLLENEGFSNEIKTGFLFCLLCSDRPIQELLNPHLQDQHSALENQFSGMTDETFDYSIYEHTREKLIEIIHGGLSDEDKQFLLSLKNITPNWKIYDFERFPAIIWKLQNLQKLKDNNPDKHLAMYESLKSKLNV